MREGRADGEFGRAVTLGALDVSGGNASVCHPLDGEHRRPLRHRPPIGTPSHRSPGGRLGTQQDKTSTDRPLCPEVSSPHDCAWPPRLRADAAAAAAADAEPRSRGIALHAPRVGDSPSAASATWAVGGLSGSKQWGPRSQRRRRPRPRRTGAGLWTQGRLTSPPEQERGHGAVHAAGQGAHDVPRRQHLRAVNFSNYRRRFRAAPEVPPPSRRSAAVVVRPEASAGRPRSAWSALPCTSVLVPRRPHEYTVRCPFPSWARSAA